jgi:hypothetical protein
MVIKRRFALLGLLAMLAAGCGGSGVTADLSKVTVETFVDRDVLNAGESFEVTCLVTDENGGEVNTGTGYTVVPSDGVETDAETVTPSKPGEYTVTCMLPDGTRKDETPETVLVTMNNITAVETTLDKETVVAGGEVAVTCEVKDKDGAVVEWDTEVLADPADGITVNGHTLETAKAGEFAVACKAVDLPVEDDTPATLTVTVGDPALVRATIKEDEVTAGTTVPVFCTVEDDAGNVLEEKAAPDAQEGIVVQESDIIPEVAGEYDVTCSAANADLAELEKVPDHLKVTAGEMATLVLKAKPKKNAYKVGDKVTIESYAGDAYGNVIEGIDAVITAPEGMKKSGEKYEFLSEGAFTFTGHLEAPYEDITGELTLICDETGPEIVVLKPERAATLTGDTVVSVEGTVTDLFSDTVELEINGTSVPVNKEGQFFHVVNAAHGMNLLTVTAVDAFGNTGKVAQSFYYSTGWVDYEPEDIDAAIIEQSMLVFLGQNFLDDGNHDKTNIDDVATLVEILLDSLSSDLFGDGLPVVDTVVPGLIDYSLNFTGFDFSIKGDLGVRLYIDAVSFAQPYVSIATRQGGIDMLISFQGTPDDPGVFLQMTVELDFLLTVSSTLGGNQLFSAGIAPGGAFQFAGGVETLLVQTGFNINKNVNEELFINVDELSIDVAGIHIEPLQDLLIDLGPVTFNGTEIFTLPEIPLGNLVSGINDFLSQYIIDPVLNFLIPMALDLLQPIVEDQVSVLLGDLLNQFEFELPIPLPQLPGAQQAAEITFKTRLSSVHFSDVGGELGMAAGFMSPKGVERTILGSLLRDGCGSDATGTPEFDSNEKMQIAAHLDMVNELLFSLWWTGGLTLSLDESVLGGVDVGGFGISDLTISTDFLLAPILDDCTAKGMVELQLGDLLLKPSFTLMGAPIKLALYVSAALDATIFGQGSEVGLTINGVTEIGTQIVSVEGDLGALAGMFDIEDLIDNVLVPMLVEQVTNLALGSFPLPEIDLGTLIPGLPAGITLSLGNLEILMTKGYLLFGGELQ